MIIEIPGCSFRVCGEKLDWQIQYEVNRKTRENTWEGKYFFPSLEFAIGKAYELALMEDANTVDISSIQNECSRVKDRLVKAVKKAIKDDR